MRKSQERTGRRSLKVAAAAAVGAAAVLAGPALPAFAATYAIANTQVAVAGGTVVYLTGGTAFTNALGTRFVTPAASACPTTYSNASATSGATTTTGPGTVKIFGAVATLGYFTTPALAAGTYKLCLYGGTLAGSTEYSTDTTSDTITAVNMGTLNATTGKAADKVTLTAASAIYSGTTYATEFVSGATTCPTTYSNTSGTVISATTVKTSTTVLTITVPAVTAGTSYLICSYAGSTVSSSALAARGSRTFMYYDTTLATATLAPNGGSSGTATTVTLSTPTAVFTGTPATLVSLNSCPATYTAGATLEPYAAVTTKISTSKVAITMPTKVIVGGTDVTTSWNVCVYASSSSGALLTAPAAYSVAPVLDVSTVQFAVGSGSAANAGSGPAQGGSSITVSGLTGVPTATGATLSASLGGSAITGITAIDATSFSGTTSAHAAGAVNLTVSTAAGSKSTSNTPYTYTYGITVSPNTAASGSSPVLDIAGAGFSTLSFLDVAESAATATKAYVLLTDNEWNGQSFNGINSAVTATPPTGYCNTVLAISDSEIICTLHLEERIASVTANAPAFAAAGDATDYVSEGTYTITVVNDGDNVDASEYNYSIVSSGSTFTVSPY